MIDLLGSNLGDGGEDSSDLAPCALLDDYWAELQRKGKPLDAQGWLSDRRTEDQAVVQDLEVLKQLHRIGRAREVGPASQSQTLVVSQSAILPSERWWAYPETLNENQSLQNDAALSSPTRDDRESVACPQRIGKYVVLEALGEGGQAFVFRVLHPELVKVFVLKLGRRPIDTARVDAASPGVRQGLLREGRLLAQCDHPNLVRVIDLDVYEGRPFVVMEPVPGLTLEQFAELHRPGPPHAARLVAELARAVAYLHAQGIVHQDIKPRNVLVDEVGRPRLIDFGLARHKHAWSDDVSETTGGTAAYMSPEQALGLADQIGPLTDVFGLGGLLYHLLTLRPLYQGASRHSVQRQAMQAEYVPVRQINRRVPRSLERICRKALAADPRRRYSSALELGQALVRTQAIRWIEAASLTLLALLAVILGVSMLAERPAKEARRAGSPAQAAPVPLPPLRIVSLDVLHFHSEPFEEVGRIGPISSAAREGDAVRVQARLNESAHFYLIALNPDGKAQLCLPPQENEAPKNDSEIQFEESTFFPLTDGPGMQVFVVLAARQSLPPFARWEGGDALKRRWRHLASDNVHGVWDYKEGLVTRVSSGPRGALEKRSDGRPAMLREVCDDLASIPRIEAVRAIAFPVMPRTPAADRSSQ
jgi:serine/threonine protein kinase